MMGGQSLELAALVLFLLFIFLVFGSGSLAAYSLFQKRANNQSSLYINCLAALPFDGQKIGRFSIEIPFKAYIKLDSMIRSISICCIKIWAKSTGVIGVLIGDQW